MPLDSRIQAMFAAASNQAPVVLERGDGARASAAMMRRNNPAQGPLEHAGARVTDHNLVAGGRTLPLRIYQPEASGPYATLVNFHGGGWVLGNLALDDARCARLVAQTGVMIVSVDYRLAPEDPYPAALEDGMAVLEWAAAGAGPFAADPARLGVTGSSSGGNIAAALALICRDRGGPRLAFQMLNYPVLDCDLDTASYREFGVGFGTGRESMDWFWDMYVGPRDRSDPYMAPLRAADLSGLPPTLIVTAECDVLRDEGEAYAARLTAADVPTVLARFDGMPHGFLMLPLALAARDAAIELSVNEIQSRLLPLPAI